MVLNTSGMLILLGHPSHQNLRTSELLYKFCHAALRILSEYDFGRCEIIKIKHAARLLSHFAKQS